MSRYRSAARTGRCLRRRDGALTTRRGAASGARSAECRPVDNEAVRMPVTRGTDPIDSWMMIGVVRRLPDERFGTLPVGREARLGTVPSSIKISLRNLPPRRKARPPACSPRPRFAAVRHGVGLGSRARPNGARRSCAGALVGQVGSSWARQYKSGALPVNGYVQRNLLPPRRLTSPRRQGRC